MVESGTYLGPGAEIRRCLLLAGSEVAHTSYVGHSVLGRDVLLGAFFCAAVRNLARGTVHMMSWGELVDTGEVAPRVCAARGVAASTARILRSVANADACCASFMQSDGLPVIRAMFAMTR